MTKTETVLIVVLLTILLACRMYTSGYEVCQRLNANNFVCPVDENTIESLLQGVDSFVKQL